MININFKSILHIIVIVISFMVTALGFAIFILVDINETDKKTKQQAIERGYALYCPSDGEFAWKGECGE